MRDRRGAYEIAPPRVRGARGLLRCSGVSGCGSKAAKRSRQTNRECVPLVRRARCPARYRRSARSLVGFRRVVVPIVVVASDGRSTPNPNTPSEGLMRYGIRDERRSFQDVLDTRVRSSDRFFVQARRSDSCVVVLILLLLVVLLLVLLLTSSSSSSSSSSSPLGLALAAKNERLHLRITSLVKSVPAASHRG